MEKAQVPDPQALRCKKPGCSYVHHSTCPCCGKRFCQDHVAAEKHYCAGEPKTVDPNEEEDPMKAPWH